jgi:general secretion pathway protein B
MSYILEALKKAQAERQLGEVPSVHAPSMQVGADVPTSGLKKPMVAAMAVMAGVIVALLALVWRKGETPVAEPVTPVASLPAAATQPGAISPAVAATQSVAVSPVAAVPPATASQTAAATQPAVAPSPSAALSAVAPRAGLAPALAASSSAPVAAGSPSAGPASAPAPASAASASTGEEVTQTARDLPEPIQRSLPPIVVGGYIYSKDPADRLLLIDKILRHEGEEVAPGLVLEKLLPKSAVFSFKGYRYHVPY